MPLEACVPLCHPGAGSMALYGEMPNNVTRAGEHLQPCTKTPTTNLPVGCSNVIFMYSTARTMPKYSRSRDQHGSRQSAPLKTVTNMLFNFNELFCISNLITALSSTALNCRWLLITWGKAVTSIFHEY